MTVFSALSDPTRVRILEILARGERSAGEIAGEFKITGAAISQHLKVLREARLVKVRAERQHRIHSLDRAGFDELDSWMRSMTSFWSERLDALEQEIRKEDAAAKRTRRSLSAHVDNNQPEIQ